MGGEPIDVGQNVQRPPVQRQGIDSRVDDRPDLLCQIVLFAAVIGGTPERHLMTSGRQDAGQVADSGRARYRGNRADEYLDAPGAMQVDEGPDWSGLAAAG